MQQTSTHQSPSELPTAQAVPGGVPTLDVPLLIDIADHAREFAHFALNTDTQNRQQAAVMFVRCVVQELGRIHGKDVADSFALAIGFENRAC